MNDTRTQTLLTLIELGLQKSSSRETLIVALDAHTLLTGQEIEEHGWRDQLAALYPQFVPGQTPDELEWAGLSKGKEKPIAIYHKGDARAYYEASEAERVGWNEYAQATADEASKDLDMGESLSAYTSVDRDDKLHSWAPPMWFPEWLVNWRLSHG